MLISADYQRQQMQLHENPNYGVASEGVASLVASIIKKSHPKTICDYGAGKKRLRKALIQLGIKDLPEYYPYDPAFPEYGDPRSAELVCCIDVLEHIEPEYLEAVVRNLATLTERLAFITIHTAAAKKTLPDGRNAHLIIKPKEWWLNIIGQYFHVNWCEDALFQNEVFLLATPRHLIAKQGNVEEPSANVPSIHVLIPGYHRNIQSLTNHPLASIRMRAAVIAKTAMELGWRVTLGEQFDKNHQLLFVGKIPANDIDQREPAWLRYISKRRASGTRVIVDYTDHYCGFPGPMSSFYKAALPMAHRLVTPSLEMADLLKTCWSGESVTIPDLCEIDQQDFRKAGPSPWRALWFGSASNVSYLTTFLNSQENTQCLRLVNVVTNITGYRLIEKWRASFVGTQKMPEIKFFDWSINNLKNAAADSDIALIPSEKNDPRKAGASENRLVTSLALGLPTVATPLKSYLPLKNYFIPLGPEWSDLLSHHVGSGDARLANVSKHLDRFREPSLTAYWEALLLDEGGRLSDSAELCTPGPVRNGTDSTSVVGSSVQKSEKNVVRLNLGCGDKILPGYINVDVAKNRQGKKPDLCCDIRDLTPIPSNFADEVLTVHVIEHFYRWEVESVLREWIRVLKPGGKLIIECPDLENAAREFLLNSAVASMGGVEGQRSMWVFYGDPSWRDPLMIHRWGYTPASLVSVLSSVGLVNVQREKAVYKLGEPRDMRVVGIKRI